MPIRYSCFISYRHPREGDELTKTFIEDLKSALRNYTGPLMNEEIYIDEERLKPGYLFNEALAEALCQSVCWIMVFTPKYFDEQATYCAREYKAMRDLELERRRKLADRKLGLIIPIVFRGPNDLPPEIKNERHFYDFSKYTLVTQKISYNPSYVEDIDKIAAYIHDVYKRLKASGDDVCTQCPTYKMPTEQDVKPMLDEIKGKSGAPQPLI